MSDMSDTSDTPVDVDAILVEASRLMKEGIRLRDEAQAPAEALDCFDRALELRRRLPIGEVPVLRYDLAACWLNRAEALVRLRLDDHRFVEALKAYDEALALLRTVPLDEDPRFARRLAIAWQNRGRLLTSRAQEGRETRDTRHTRETREAIASFMEAITVLERHGALVSDRQRLLAAIWMNTAIAWMTDAHEHAPDRKHGHEHGHGHAHEHEISTSQAADAARLAIAIVAASEQDDADAAEVGLQARHVLCLALAVSTRAGAVEPATDIAADDIHEATDLADDGLALVEHWERRGITRFRALASDLFRFGAHVYAIHQPRFLREFLQEHLDPARSSRDYVESDEMRGAAQDTSPLQPVTYRVTLAVHVD
jgi:tetratricopeptide (TPR) repeat protein